MSRSERLRSSAHWLPIGVAIGCGLGVAMGNIALGVAVGVGIGVALVALGRSRYGRSAG